MIERLLLVATDWTRDQPQLTSTKQYRRYLATTTTLTRTAYADKWVQNSIETVLGAVTSLSDDGSICSGYEVECERNGHLPLTKQNANGITKNNGASCYGTPKRGPTQMFVCRGHHCYKGAKSDSYSSKRVTMAGIELKGHAVSI